MKKFKILNYSLKSDLTDIRPGIIIDDKWVLDIKKSFPSVGWAKSTMTIFENWTESQNYLKDLAEQNLDGALNLNSLKLHAPLLYPSAIYCAGANYMDHAKEMSAEGSGFDKSKTQPYLFLKSARHCLIGPGDKIHIPNVTNSLDWEGEFAVVIGKYARNISIENAMDYVAGYTIMNDLSARNLARREDWPRWGIDWFGHKNFDGAAPLGPWITPSDQIEDHTQCHLRLWVNDEKKQDSLVDGLIFKVPELIEYLSRRMTLRPGDVIATGTPAGVGRPKGTFLKSGDVVKIEISGIGTLENPVVQGI
jgi:2-keto-4-pentenoate hydratase/2-oxohepta-3-ene-1,7-dioic acid hydratase in catechol pathway